MRQWNGILNLPKYGNGYKTITSTAGLFQDRHFCGHPSEGIGMARTHAHARPHGVGQRRHFDGSTVETISTATHNGVHLCVCLCIFRWLLWEGLHTCARLCVHCSQLCARRPICLFASKSNTPVCVLWPLLLSHPKHTLADKGIHTHTHTCWPLGDICMGSTVASQGL